jgi:hypothetical protein
MKLLLQRDAPDGICTLGELFIDDVHECYTLERLPFDSANPATPMYGQLCCISPGIFPVIVGWSDHFERVMPKVNDVPDRTAIEIHFGNRVTDSLGCILVGEVKSQDVILDSDAAFDELFPKIQAGCLADGVTLEVRNAT